MAQRYPYAAPTPEDDPTTAGLLPTAPAIDMASNGGDQNQAPNVAQTGVMPTPILPPLGPDADTSNGVTPGQYFQDPGANRIETYYQNLLGRSSVGDPGAAGWYSDPTAYADIANSAEAKARGTTAAPAPVQSFGAAAPSGSPSSISLSGGDSPLSGAISGGLQDLIHSHGMTPEQQSVYATLSQLIGQNGVLPEDDPMINQQLEGARENESSAFTGQLADARAELANRGLLGEPGIGQGSEASAIDRITQNTAPTYAQAVRDIRTGALSAQTNRLTSALSTITGLSNDAAGNLVQTLGTGTQRQLGLAQIALDSLGQNTQWNEFLANFGLSRDSLMYQIQNGQIANLLPLLQMFGSFAGISAGGNIGA